MNLYTIHVSHKGVNIFGHNGLVDRGFSGTKANSIYHKIVQDYANKQKEETLPF